MLSKYLIVKFSKFLCEIIYEKYGKLFNKSHIYL